MRLKTELTNALHCSRAGRKNGRGYRHRCTLSLWRSILIFFTLSAPVFANAQSLGWIKGIGGIYDDKGYAIATDEEGNVYVAGGYSSPEINFNPDNEEDAFTNPSSSGSDNIFIVKYDPSGAYVWGKNVGGTNYDYGYKLIVSGTDIYISGVFGSTIDFDPEGSEGSVTSSGNDDVFLAKLDTDGNFQWVRSMGGFSYESVTDMAVDPDGNIYLTGSFNSPSVSINGGSGGSISNSSWFREAFVVKYDADGNHVWSRNIGGDQYEYGYGVATDSEGAVYLTGTFTSAMIDFNPEGTDGAIYSSGALTSYFVKLDASGDFVWAKSFEGMTIMDVEVDQADDVVAAGFFSTSSLDFNPDGDGGMISNTGSEDIFLVKFNADGEFKWVKNMEGGSYDMCNRIALDANRNIFMTGYYESTTIDFNPGGASGTLTNFGSMYGMPQDSYIAKFDWEGNFVSARTMGGDYSDEGKDMATDNNGNIYTIGMFKSSTLYINPGSDSDIETLDNTSDFFLDVYIVKWVCNETSSSSLAVETCMDVYDWNGIVYTESGEYTQVFNNASGCDSTAYLTLDFIKLNPVITLAGDMLTTTEEFESYQWLKDGVEIEGADERDLILSGTGSYQVIVLNEEGCRDTSDVFTYPPTSVEEVSEIGKHIIIYPNPFTDYIYIKAPVELNVSLTTLEGKEIISNVFYKEKIDVHFLQSGIYIIKICDQDGNLLKVGKILKK